MNQIAASSLHSRSDGVGCSFPVAPVSLGTGEGSLVGDFETAHNFTYQRADWPRLIPVGVNGVVETFIYYPFHAVQYGE